MDNPSPNLQNQKYLPTSLLNDIEFDELDKELQLMESCEKNNSASPEK